MYFFQTTINNPSQLEPIHYRKASDFLITYLELQLEMPNMNNEVKISDVVVKGCLITGTVQCHWLCIYLGICLSWLSVNMAVGLNDNKKTSTD